MEGANQVDKLMQQFDLEQLTQIQLSLKEQIKNKREELRQMVGRRYRDVLEASNTVKRLREISGELALILKDLIRGNVNNQWDAEANVRGRRIYAKKEWSQKLMLLQSLLHMSFASDDLLSRTYNLCLADRICQTIISDSCKTVDEELLDDNRGIHSFMNNLRQLLQLFSDQLLQIRIELLDDLEVEIGEVVDWQQLTSDLVAYTLLKPQSIKDLLSIFLQSRMNYSMVGLRATNLTLLDFIRSMKETVKCADQVFGSGEGFISAFQCIGSQGWCPAPIKEMLESQPLVISRFFEAELAVINERCSSTQSSLPDRHEVQQYCSEWILKMCDVAGKRVQAMCNYFDNVDQAVEFTVAINQIFESDWSNIFKSSSLIYGQLFGNAFLDRFQELIGKELFRLEQELRAKLTQINCAPTALFDIKKAKFDALLASGVSTELNELVQQLSFSLRNLHQKVKKYINIGQERQVEQLPNVLADQILAFVDRLTNFSTWKFTSNSSSKQSPAFPILDESITFEKKEDEQDHWLTIFRLLLALVQQEPSALCYCMDHNVEKIVECNRKLHNAIEKTLCYFMDTVIEDCAQTGNIRTVVHNYCSSWNEWSGTLQVLERVQLDDTTTLSVPTQLSLPLFLFLSNIYIAINQHSLGHLFTSNVTLHVSQQIGNFLSELLLYCAEHCAPIPQLITQLLFDSKVLFLMFPDRSFIKSAQIFEDKLGSIEFTVMEEPLSRNAKLFSMRTAMLFGQLQAEPVSMKERKLLPSYSQLIDIIPKRGDVQRLAQIPRLSKLKEENQKSIDDISSKTFSRKQRKINAGFEPDKGLVLPVKGVSSSSFSSLYDKISTGWFKS